MPTPQELFDIRLNRVNDAIALKEPDMMPMIVQPHGNPYDLYDIGATHRNDFYDHDLAVEAFVKYHEEFEPDIGFAPLLTSGRANEIAGSTMLDWPGKPGTRVANTSTHQIIEQEYMLDDEYDEMLDDYTGFIKNKYIPRAYPGLAAFGDLGFNPSAAIGVGALASWMNDTTIETFKNAIEMIEAVQKTAAISAEVSQKLIEMGFPPYMSGIGQVPFDTLGDYFRGTMGIFDDLIERPEQMARACEKLMEIQLQEWAYLQAPIPVKRVFIPMHKGMDSFISPDEYAELYWKPFQPMLRWLISVGATPIIYTEGAYNTRIEFIREQLLEFPPGSCIIHFEEGDFAHLKKRYEGIACLSGGMSLYLLEYGTPQQVADRVKYLVDNCADGGGYLLNTGGSMDKVNRKNMEVMFETARTYGKK